MVKFRATKKEIQEGYWKVFQVGYCEAQTILSVCKIYARAYNAGLYGWNWDCFEVDPTIAIITGYRGTFGNSIPDLENWEREASEIKESWWQNKDNYEEKVKDFKQRFVAYLESL